MQGHTKVILGIDAGTTSVKTVAFALDGQVLSVARSSVHIIRGSQGEAEADMDGIWAAAVTTIQGVVEELTDCQVVAIGVTGQGDGAWFVDSNGRPVRNTSLWLDGRASARLDEWVTDGRAAAMQSATGSPPFAGALPLLVEELSASEPGFREAIAAHLNCKDWLRFRLTGEIATDPSEASRTYLDTATGSYSRELLDRLGHGFLASVLAEVRDPQSIAGTVDDAVAKTLGIPPGTPVAVGLVDTAAAGVGIGVLHDGEGYAILGTTGFVGVNHASRSLVRNDGSIVLATGRGHQVLESLAPMAGTPNLDWARATLGYAGQEWEVVEQDAAAVAPGSDGVLFLPYGSPSGERAPFSDSAASAGWLGASVTTTRPQLLRSVYEGLAYSLVECLDALGLDGSLTICGGGSESDLLCGILADVSGLTVVRQSEPEVGARGSAALAGAAVGLFDDLESAVRALQPEVMSFAPNPARHALYRQAFTTFKDTRDAVRPHWESLRRLRTHSREFSRPKTD